MEPMYYIGLDVHKRKPHRRVAERPGIQGGFQRVGRAFVLLTKAYDGRRVTGYVRLIPCYQYAQRMHADIRTWRYAVQRGKTTF